MKAGAKKQSKLSSDSWCTNHDVADRLEQFFDGPVGVDPCSNPQSIINALNAYHAAGLHKPWTQPRTPRTVYRNNPYSKTDPWIDKAIRELRKSNEAPVEEEVGLVMVSTSTGWWRKMCGVEPVLLFQNEDGSTTTKPNKKGAMSRRKPNEIWAPRARLLFTGRLKFRGDVGFGARFDTVLSYYGTRVREFEREFKSITKWAAWGEKR